MLWPITILIILGAVILAEVGLRVFFGFGNLLIYLQDDEIGYLLKPNQQVRRMGNKIKVNEYSMRGDSVSKTRETGEFRVFLLGDSVANGGWWTDQKDTISQMLERGLQQQGVEKVTVLNASANSWSPRNELAYLKRFGLFDAQVLVLLINTDDLFGTIPTPIPVGRDRTYPDKKPPLALIEVYQRYLSRPQPIPELEAISQEKGDRVGKILTAIEQIQQQCSQNNAQFILALTPLIREIGEPGSRDYEKKARERLQTFVNDHQITYLDFLPIFRQETAPEHNFRDHIHLSPVGNQKVSDHLVQFIQSFL